MKRKLTNLIIVIAALAASSGCMTATAVTKSINSSIAPVINSLAKDSNSCHLRIISPAFTLEFDRNGAVAAPAVGGSVSLTPMTTFKVEQKP